MSFARKEAKNRAIDRVRRERTARTFAPELSRHVESEWTLAPAVVEAFEPASISRRTALMLS
jgi:RNA polymerase sigma-70 factor (ECF subfamily)